MILIWRASTPTGKLTNGRVENYMELTENFRVNGCEEYPAPFPPSALEITTGGEPTDFFYAGPMFIVSGEMCQLLEKFEVNAEFFPLTTLQKGRPYDRKEFYFANILDAVECFDFEKSEYTMTEYGADQIENLVLDDKKAAGYHLFRVGQIPAKRRNPKAVRDIIRCASDELATAIMRANLTGVAFVTPEHWRDYPASVVAWEP
jgi:hypothetical protein